MSDLEAAAQLACETFYSDPGMWGRLDDHWRQKWRDVADAACLALTQQGETTPVSGDEVERLMQTSDPMERIVEAALLKAGIAFKTDAGGGSPANLDFYIPALDLHIEVKRLHSDRIAAQMARAANVIAAQGKPAVEALAQMIAALHPTDQEAIRREALEEAARVAETHQPLGYMSERERSYCREHGEEIATAIRALMSASEKEGGR